MIKKIIIIIKNIQYMLADKLKCDDGPQGGPWAWVLTALVSIIN